jgi:hypothetical protein
MQLWPGNGSHSPDWVMMVPMDLKCAFFLAGCTQRPKRMDFSNYSDIDRDIKHGVKILPHMAIR